MGCVYGFKDRLYQGLLDGALDYVNYNEEPLAFEIICDNICEYDITIKQDEYGDAIKLVQDMGFDVTEAPFRHLKALVVS